jgi:hypothetical protein
MMYFKIKNILYVVMATFLNMLLDYGWHKLLIIN